MRACRAWLVALALWPGADRLRADVITSQPWPELGGALLLPYTCPASGATVLVPAWDGSPAEGGDRLVGLAWPGVEGAVACLVFPSASAAVDPDPAHLSGLPPGHGGRGRFADGVTPGWGPSGAAWGAQPDPLFGQPAGRPHGGGGGSQGGSAAFAELSSGFATRQQQTGGTAHASTAGVGSPGDEPEPAAQQVPEPSTALLLVLGGATLALLARRQQRKC